MKDDADARAEIRRQFQRCPASFKAKNPHIFGDAGTVVGLRSKESKRNRRSEGQNCILETGAESVRYSITFTVLRRRALDEHDNSRSALKPAVDFITERLGFKSDADPRLQWHYEQFQTKGRCGVLVTIVRSTTGKLITK
jgi:hypothetical protein